MVTPLHRRRPASVAAAVVLVVAVGCTGAPEAPATQATSSDRSTTAAQPSVAATGIDERIDVFLDSSYSGALDNVRAALVWVDGEPVVERYFDSSAEATSNVFSVTKSVMSIVDHVVG